MKKSNLKYYIGIFFIIFIDSLHNIFFKNNDKFDIYLFYNHSRYLTNILYDISNLFKFSILTYWLININRRIFTPLFILSIGVWISYFTFYNQITSLLLIPLYIITVIYYNKKTAMKWKET